MPSRPSNKGATVRLRHGVLDNARHGIEASVDFHARQ